MLGVLTLERGLLQWGDLLPLIVNGLMGGAPYAILGMLLLLLATRLNRDTARILLPRPWMRPALLWCLLLCIVATAGRWILLWRAGVAGTLVGLSGSGWIQFFLVSSVVSGVLGGLVGLAGVGIPFVYGLGNLSFRRIWAMTRLSFQEGIRRRVLYVFSALLVVLMFTSWFMTPSPRDQLKTYVTVIDLAMTPLLLFAGVLVAAFSIPTDIRQQTIHTVLTKPVERFEVVLGRFLGYVGLMTVVLVVLSLVGVLYVVRSIDPEAAAATLKARDPWYGSLLFENTKDRKVATNVGREWDYRTYIAGPQGQGVVNLETAIWNYPEPAASLASRDKVRCEFAFDIYRTTKGHENRGVVCDFEFTTWKYDKSQEAERTRRQEELKKQGKAPLEIEDAIAAEFGYFRVSSKKIIDYQTLYHDVPGGLFKHAIPKDAAERKKLAEIMSDEAAIRTGALVVAVTCSTPAQYVGVARSDLYLRQDAVDGSSDRLWFALNFFKSAFGLWLRLCLVIGLAVCLSTYLSGVVSLLIALLIYLGGFFREFIASVAFNQSPGGGPAESFYRLTTRSTMSAPLDNTVTTNIAQGADVGFRFLVRLVLDMIPDVARYDFVEFVSEGFNIPMSELLGSFILLFLYLVPWFILAFFTMKSREIASGS